MYRSHRIPHVHDTTRHASLDKPFSGCTATAAPLQMTGCSKMGKVQLSYSHCIRLKQQTVSVLQVYDETEPDSADKPVLGEKGRRYKKVNWMKGAFLSADKILTVSPTYAEEIAANESQGVELDSIIRYISLPCLLLCSIFVPLILLLWMFFPWILLPWMFLAWILLPWMFLP